MGVPRKYTKSSVTAYSGVSAPLAIAPLSNGRVCHVSPELPALTDLQTPDLQTPDAWADSEEGEEEGEEEVEAGGWW